MVVVNRELLDRLYAQVPDAHPADRETDLTRILVHEIYGHAIPYLLAGHLRGACADPADTRQLGCSVARENVIMPMAEDNGSLRVLVSDPQDFETLEKLQNALKGSVSRRAGRAGVEEVAQ